MLIANKTLWHPSVSFFHQGIFIVGNEFCRKSCFIAVYTHREYCWQEHSREPNRKSPGQVFFSHFISLLCCFFYEEIFLSEKVCCSRKDLMDQPVSQLGRGTKSQYSSLALLLSLFWFFWPGFSATWLPKCFLAMRTSRSVAIFFFRRRFQKKGPPLSTTQKRGENKEDCRGKNGISNAAFPLSRESSLRPV